MLEMMTKATESNGGSDMENSLGALTSMTSSVTKMAPLLKRMEELSQESEILQKEMSEKELQLFLNSYAKIMFRLSKMGTIK